jgi:nucleotide-binding universal stress UspA family protein
LVGRTLVERSAAAQLLIVGTHEHVGLNRLIAGSVGHYCLNRSVCPVVAVPPASSQAPTPGKAEATTAG